MKRILINATHAEEIRVALCNGNHLYDFDLENRTREQKKANIYKGRVTRVEPSLEAVFVEYGAERQGFLPIREIANEYLSGDPRSTTNIKQLIKEGDELIVQVEKEERGNKGAALSTLVSLAGRYLVLMPNNARGGGISRQISGKLREEMKQALSELQLPKGMSVIIRTAGIGKTTDDLQHDLNHLLTIWQGIQAQNQKYPAPRLMHQEAGVVTRAVRDYLRDDISEIWVDNANAYNEAANFIEAVMPQQLSKLRKYADYEPMFARFGIEKQIETAYQREVRLPSGGSIVIDQTEALVSIDINSSKATKGADVSETAFNTNLEAADEIARQLRLRDMGGLIVIDFIDMATDEHQKQVENRIKEATKNDRARIQFAEISRFGLLEMSRQRLRPSLEEATGYLCPRCHGTGMIRDLRSLALSIMRQIEQKALQERQGEVQADVPTEIAAFLLNEKRDSLVYLEQESGTRITILPHAHMESPDFTITYNREGFAPSSYERVTQSEQHENQDRGYDTSNWHTDENDTPRVARIPAKPVSNTPQSSNAQLDQPTTSQPAQKSSLTSGAAVIASVAQPTSPAAPQSSAVAWLSNLFAPTQQAQVTHTISSQDAAAAIESIVNSGAKSLGIQGQLAPIVMPTAAAAEHPVQDEQSEERREKRNNRRPKNKKSRYQEADNDLIADSKTEQKLEKSSNEKSAVEKQEKFEDIKDSLPKREPNSRREARGEKHRRETLTADNRSTLHDKVTSKTNVENASSNLDSVTQSAVSVSTNADLPTDAVAQKALSKTDKSDKDKLDKKGNIEPNQVNVQVHKAPDSTSLADHTVHLSLDNSKPNKYPSKLDNEPVRLTELSSQDSLLAIEPIVHQDDTNKAAAQDSTTVVDNPNVVDLPINTSAIDKPSVAQLRLDVTPTQGRAKNDPREVYRAFSEHFGIAQAPQQTSVTTNTMRKITGTVQQFISEQLGNHDETRVVADFILAVDKFNQANQAADSTPMQDHGSSSIDFGEYFRNYGYPHLSQQSLHDYHQAIRPQGQFHIVAGKTDASPAPVIQRASNDPRGQVVVQQTIQAESVVTLETPAALVDTNQTSETVTQPTTAEITATQSSDHSFSKGSVGAWIVEQLGEQGQTLIEQGHLVTAYLQAQQAVTPTSANQTTDEAPQTLPTEGKPIKMKLGKPVNKPAADISDHQEDIDDTLQPADLTLTSDDNQPKGKTTPTSYKNMIESVAEQLKPSAGSVLNLPVPKVPKVRTRKAKTTEKAPAKPKTRTSKKVENVVIVKKPKAETAIPAETLASDDNLSS